MAVPPAGRCRRSPVRPSPLLLRVLPPFAAAFTRPTFAHVLTLVAGALLASGRRTVAAALRAVGLGEERHFTTVQRVLNRAAWSPLMLSRSVLGLLVSTFLAPAAPLILLIDGTLERRWGPKIALKGRYPDAVRSTKGHPVTTEGISTGGVWRGSCPAPGARGSGRCPSSPSPPARPQ